MSTPHPPAVVSTATFGPRGSGCVANVAAASNASSTVAARLTPACRHMPAKTRSSLASAPVCDAAARWPPDVAPPVHQDERLLARGAPQRVEERAAVAHALEVREADVGGGVGREVLEVVGDADHGGVAGRHGAADADRRLLSARFSNVDTMLPDWLAMPIRPAGGYGATICAQSDDGVDTTPWPFGPASRTPASSATAASSCSARRPASPASA